MSLRFALSLAVLSWLGAGLTADAINTKQTSLLTPQVPAPLASWNFTTNSPESYGFTNVRAGSYYVINSAGDFAVVNANTSAYASYGATPWLGNTPSGVNLGLTVWSGYAMGVRNNSMQGAVNGSATELTTNGNFALNPLSGSQNTLLNGWQWTKSGSGLTPTWDGVGSVTLTGNLARLTSGPLTTVIGQTYTVLADISSPLTVWVGTTAGGSNLLVKGSASGGPLIGQAFSFVATTTTSFLSFNNANTTPSIVSNVSVRAGLQPTNWQFGRFVGSTNIGTLAATVSAQGVQNGIDTITETIAGTTAGAGYYQVCFENEVFGNAATAQYIGEQLFAKIVGGDTTGISSITVDLNEVSTPGALVQRDQSAALSLPTSGAYTGSLQFNQFLTSGGASTAHVQPCIGINYASAQTINISLQIGWPMYGVSTFPQPSPPLRTTGTNPAVGTDNITIPVASIPGFPSTVTRFGSVSEVYIPVNNAQAPSFTGSSPFSMDDGSSADRYASGMGTSGGGSINGTASAVVVGGALLAIQDGRIQAALRTIHCFASVQSTTEASLALDGGPTSAAWGASPPIAFTTLRLGRNSNGTNIFDGYIRKMKIWPNLPAYVSASMLSRQCEQ